MGVEVTPTNIKSIDSIIRKTNDDYNGDFTKVRDSIRTTFISNSKNHESIVSAIKSKYNIIGFHY